MSDIAGATVRTWQRKEALRQARIDALEEAAKEVEQLGTWCLPRDYATAIRKLKETGREG